MLSSVTRSQEAGYAVILTSRRRTRVHANGWTEDERVSGGEQSGWVFWTVAVVWGGERGWCWRRDSWTEEV